MIQDREEKIFFNSSVFLIQKKLQILILMLESNFTFLLIFLTQNPNQ